MTQLSFRIPNYHPPRINQWDGRHWSRRSSLKKDCRALIAAYAAMGGVPKASGRRLVALTICLKKGQRAGDPDAYWKATLDALVACQLLTDDNRQGVELAPVAFNRLAGWWGTVITLEDIDQ